MNNKIKKSMERAVHVLEFAIALIILIGIAVGLFDLVKYFILIIKTPPIETYDIFHTFLGHCLLLLVGAEFIYMIIHHSTKSLLELILYVIARKMLIYSHSMTDLVFGTVSLAFVFIIIRYLIPKENTKVLTPKDGEFSLSLFKKIFKKENKNTNIGAVKENNSEEPEKQTE